MESAVLDACVLFQGGPTNLLLCLAEHGAFDPVWSDEIHEEWTRNLRGGGRIPWDRIIYRRRQMDAAFPAASCAAPPDLIARIRGMCDTDAGRKDAHVIATAVAAEATIIVTENISDFPRHVLDRFGMSAARIDDFCVRLYGTDRHAFLPGARAHRESMKRPAFAPADYVALLARETFRMPRTAAALAPHQDEL
jgi:hypothetical protein